MRVKTTGLLLFGSGACALIYQTVWLREFRLIFGASTAASAAVLATFYLLENFGNLKTLIAAALLNSLIGMAALSYSNQLRRPRGKSRVMGDEVAAADDEAIAAAAAPATFVYAAAAIVGFAFFL